MSIKRMIFSAMLVSGILAGEAKAVPFIQVWTGPVDGVNGSITASLGGKPTGTADASFFYNGPLNWENNEPQNTVPTGNLVKNFLNTLFISNFSSPNSTYVDVTAFGNASLSIAGNDYATYFLIEDTYNSSTIFNGVVDHDDGVSIYVGDSNIPVLVSPGETPLDIDNYILPAGNQKITITYVKSNGAPSILRTVYPAPEPGVLALLGSGLIGLGMLSWRRQRQS